MGKLAMKEDQTFFELILEEGPHHEDHLARTPARDVVRNAGFDSPCWKRVKGLGELVSVLEDLGVGDLEACGTATQSLRDFKSEVKILRAEELVGGLGILGSWPRGWQWFGRLVKVGVVEVRRW